MMTRMVNGERIEMTPEEEAEYISFKENVEAPRLAKQRLDEAKAKQKEKLIRQKVESLLSAKLSAVDAAKTEAEVETVIL